MDGVVQISINGDAKPEGEAIPDNLPLWFKLYHRQEKEKNQNGYNPSGHSSLDGVGYVPLGLEEEIGLKCKIAHRQKE